MTHGIHLIWTTYGTWLPGDPRGHWSPLFDCYRQVREKGGKLNVPDVRSRHVATATMTEPPKWLDAEEQTVVAGEMARHLAPGLPGVRPESATAAGSPGEGRASRAGDVVARRLADSPPHPGQGRGYMPAAWAAAIEPNHVHLLVGTVDEDIGRFAGRLKGTTSSAVGLLPRNRHRARVWSTGFWQVFLFDDLAVATVKAYIDDHNIRRGLPGEPFAWLSACPYGSLRNVQPVRPARS